MHDHAHIDFPLLPADTFSLGAAASLADDKKDPAHMSSAESFLADPGSGATDKITRAIGKVVRHFNDSIKTEALISLSLLLLWFLNFFLGSGRAIFLLFTKQDKVRGVGGPDPFADQNAVQMRSVIPAPPDHGGPAPAYEPPADDGRRSTDNPFQNFRSMRRGHNDDYEGEWQDRKLGFAGLREPAQVAQGRGRTSEYGMVEKN